MTTPPSRKSGADRAHRLRAQRERVTAELVGVENGVLPLLETRGRATAADVATALQMSIPGANNALSALLRAGFISRSRVPVQGGGRAYVYEFPPR